MLEENISGKMHQVCRFVINAKAADIWKILTDYNNATYVFPCLKKCRLVADKGSTKLVEHHIRPSGVPTNFEYLLEIKEHDDKLLQQWRRVKGDFAALEGFWKLEPLDNGAKTQVTYASYIDGGFFLPQGLIKRQTKIDMPQVMTALRNQAETSKEIATTRRQESSH